MVKDTSRCRKRVMTSVRRVGSRLASRIGGGEAEVVAAFAVTMAPGPTVNGNLEALSL